MFGPSRLTPVLRPLLTSADSVASHDAGSRPRRASAISPGKNADLPPVSPPHLRSQPLVVSDFTLSCKLVRLHPPDAVVFLGARICRRLPSDSDSRRTPLPLANGCHDQAPQRTLTSESTPMPSAQEKETGPKPRLPFVPTQERRYYIGRSTTPADGACSTQAPWPNLGRYASGRGSRLACGRRSESPLSERRLEN
jgi:hypothetical protein